MATAMAKLIQHRNPLPVVITDLRGRPRWHPIWENNPRIQRELRGRYQTLVNGPNARPYVAAKNEKRWTWKPFNIQPGEIYLTEAEKTFGARYAGRILVEPNTKGTNEGNKDWGWDRWQEFAKRVPNLLQVGPAGTRRLDGVEFVETPDFRLAAAVLAVSQAYCGTEGAMHHAAAALGVRAVVIFGGFISPAVTGYSMHRNLFTGGTACGSRVQCLHCRQAMAKISVDMVERNLKEIL